MSKSTVPWRLIIFAACCLTFGVISWFAYSPESPTVAIEKSDQSDNERYVDVSVPDSQWSPEEVIERQIKSMHDGIADPEKLAICYSLASPENRQMTGPFERFATMIMTPPYDRLATCKEWKLDPAKLDEDIAELSVTTVASSGEETVFRFVLRQQSLAPYRGCWLTEAVVIEQH